MAPEAPVPLLTVSGFLGAGKTTLVNRILAEARGRRFVVFVNDFGAINIDVELVDEIAEDRVSLKNGCVCCSLNANFVKQVIAFAGLPAAPDVFLVEASGVADPRALDASLAMLEAAGHIQRDVAIHMLDADQFGTLDYADCELLIDHAAACDIVLVNKADLAPETRLRDIDEMLRISAPYSHVVRSVRADVALSLLMEPALPRPPQRAARKEKLAPHQQFRHWQGEASAPISRAAFDRFARVLTQHCIRVKGFLWFSDAPSRAFLFNLVGTRAYLEAHARSGAARHSRLVGIGLPNRMDSSELDRAFGYMLDEANGLGVGKT